MKKLLAILALSTFSLMANAESMSVVAITDIAPEYPESALRQNKSGYVSVRFDLAENGKAYNATVIDAYPDKSFNSAALTALKRSNFQVMDSSSTELSSGVTNIERTYRFNQENPQEIGMN